MSRPVILLIEPNKILVQTYKKVLEANGYAVNTAASAQAAIASADGQEPAVVVLELQLAKHNGIEFLYEFRSYTEWQDIPVIVNSDIPSSKFTKSRRELELLGVSRYLYKPKTSLKSLLGAVESELADEP